MLRVLWNWTLYGTLVVQLCGFSHARPISHDFVCGTHRLVKTYTAIISQEIRNSLSCWVCTTSLFTSYALRPDDSSSAVYSVFLAETLQTALTGADLYYWFVSGFGKMNHLNSPYLSALDVPIIGSIISFTVQLFFVYRIWVLSGRSSWSRFLCLSICLVSRSYQPRSQTSLSNLSVLRCWLRGCVLWECLCTSYLSQAISNLAHICIRRRQGHRLTRSALVVSC